MDTVKIFDTTLRDGEQSPGISLDVAEKLEIADQLARLGVDIIEAGFPIASDGDFEAVEAIAKSVKGPIIAGLSRTVFKDVDRAWEAVRHADRKRIHIFIATSKIHMEKKLRMTPEQVKQEAAQSVARAKGYLDDVEFSPEDGYRSDPDFMCEVCQIAVDNGATTLNIPDTVGYAVPEDYARLIRYVIDTVRGDFTVSTHCHDDLGLAVANSLAGVAAGARQVECAINGLGERAGNAALEEIVMAIKTRSDYFGTSVDTKTDELARTSRLVSRLTGYHVQYNKAVVGRNAFAHESGIHQHGVLADRNTYEIIDASHVGQEAAQIVLGKHSGRHAFADTLKKMGINVQGDALNSAFVRFKELADKKVEITEADLEAIVAEEVGDGMVHRYAIHELELHGGTAAKPTARVVLILDDGKIEAAGTGDGMIDAAIAAIAEATGVSGKVSNFQVQSVTGGSDALGAVIVTVETDGRRVTGRGVATDVVEASARGYLNAVNKIIRLRERGDEVREMEVGPVSVNLWTNADHALSYLKERDQLPHRVDAMEVVLELLAGKPVTRVLDLGTGDGNLLALVLAAFPDATGVGLDFGDEMLRRAEERFAGDNRVQIRRHDLSEPLPADLSGFDAIVSSFAIHHLDPPRVGELYGEVRGRLRPGGVFANAEHVASPTRELHDEFLAALRRTPADDDPSNQLVSVEQQLTWLNACGFVNSDCFWKWRELAVVAGTNPG